MKEEQENQRPRRPKAVIQVLSALPVGFDGKAKSGGVAPGIQNAIPAMYEMVRWLGIMKSEGNKKDYIKEQKLRSYGIKQGFDKKNESTQTFQNYYVKPSLFKEFYTKATNGTLWPLMHSMPEKKTKKSKFKALESINQDYSNKLIGIMDELLAERNQDIPDNEKETYKDLTIWIHDYQVFHVAGMIKDLAKEKALHPEDSPQVSFFHHEPWPHIRPRMGNGNSIVDIDTGLVQANFTPKEKKEFETILSNLIKADTIGFHTEKDSKNFLETVVNFGVLKKDSPEYKKLEPRVFVNPIGVPKPSMKQNFLTRAPFLKRGLTSDTELNQVLDEKQRTLVNRSTQIPQNNTTSNDLDMIEDSAIEYREKQKEAVAKFEAKVKKLRKSFFIRPTPNQEKMIAASAKIVSRMMKGGASFYDQMTVGEQFYFDPKKTHINSVQRFDYTKGIEEFLNGYEKFLEKLKDQKGLENPGELYQFNLITGKGRSGDPVHEYTKYEKKCKSMIKKINEKYPGAIYHYKDGIPNPELPMTNAASDILLVSSVEDGFVLAGPEILESIIASLEENMQNEDYDPQLIISNNVGLARSLEKIEGKPERLQLVEPNGDSFQKALMNAHVNREKTEKCGNRIGRLDRLLKELNLISNAIPDSMGTFSEVAFAAIEAAKLGKNPSKAADKVREEHKKIRDDKYFDPKEVRGHKREMPESMKLTEMASGTRDDNDNVTLDRETRQAAEKVKLLAIGSGIINDNGKVAIKDKTNQLEKFSRTRSSQDSQTTNLNRYTGEPRPTNKRNRPSSSYKH